MIGLTFTIENINTVIQVFDQIQVIRYGISSSTAPAAPEGQPITLTDWAVISGTDDYPIPITLTDNITYYMTYDPEGKSDDWYSSRYYDNNTGTFSAWSDPILGKEGDLYYDPVYPYEAVFSPEENAIIDRIRLYIGDPLDIIRDYGEETILNLHPDGKTYELSEKGWPVYITIAGKGFTSRFNPAVNGYKYLKFQTSIDDLCQTCVTEEDLCGNETTKTYTSGIDIWYYTFRNSDKQLLDAYDSCPPPAGLTVANATTESYILQTSINIVRRELLEDATEDGASLSDEGSKYNPEPGLKIRKDLLDDLQKRLDDLIKSLVMKGISGVLID